MIFLLRHGQVQGSDKKRFIGATDASLDYTGMLQALYWKKTFLSFNFEAIYSSSLQRCSHTAGLIANGKEIIAATALNEINMGSWDGKTFDQVKRQRPKEFEKRGQAMDTFKTRDGESFYDVSCRVLPFFENCVNTLKKKNLLITHAGVIRVILCHILKLKLKDLFQIKLSYGELFILQKTNDQN